MVRVLLKYLEASEVCGMCVSVPRKWVWLLGGERGRLYLPPSYRAVEEDSSFVLV